MELIEIKIIKKIRKYRKNIEPNILQIQYKHGQIQTIGNNW